MRSVVKIAYQYHPKMQSLDIADMAHKQQEKFMTHFKNYLKTFGHCLQHIEFVNEGQLMDDGTAREIFTYIIIYCLGSLQSLKMRGIHLEFQLLSRAHMVFKYLKKLDIDEHLSWFDILPMCSKLEELRTQCDQRSIPYEPNYELPQLKTFAFAYNSNRSQSLLNSTLKRFFDINPTIRTLSLTVPYHFNMAIIGRLKHLEVLDISSPQPPAAFKYFERANYYQVLGQLKDLVEISIHNYESAELAKILVAADGIERVHIRHGMIDDVFVTALSQLRHIKCLKLSSQQIDATIKDETWQELRRLNTIERLTLDDIQPTITKLLDSLDGNCNTLKHLHVSKCFLDEETDTDFASLLRFKNLEVLDSDCYIPMEYRYIYPDYNRTDTSRFYYQKQ